MYVQLFIFIFIISIYIIVLLTFVVAVINLSDFPKVE